MGINKLPYLFFRQAILKAFLSLLCLFFATVSSAQNLVPNPSFEDTVACPTMGGQIFQAVGWQNWGITPDYFNSCRSGVLGVPNNGWGYQIPVQGNAYVGMACNLSTVPNVREFMGRQLSQPLVVGQRYFVSFNVSLSDIPSGCCAINHLGIKFSTVQYDSSAPPPLNNFSHIYADSIISDTLNWTRIAGSFVADSAYTYVMLGNFFDNAHIDTSNCPTMAGTYSYYFFDMICVSTNPEYCSSDPLAVPKHFSSQNKIYVYPTPADYFLRVSCRDEIYHISIYSTLSKIVFSQGFGPKKSIEIPTYLFADDMYFLQVYTNTEIFISKFQIVHK